MTDILHTSSCQDKFEDTKGESEAINQRRTDNTMANRTRGSQEPVSFTWL